MNKERKAKPSIRARCVAKTSKDGGRAKMHIFLLEEGEPWLQAMEVKRSLMMLKRGECVCVCVYEELNPCKLLLKLEELSHKMNTIASFYS